MDEDTAEWFFRHDFKIAVSLDGSEEIHNRHRFFNSGEGSFDTVWRNTQLLKRVYGARFNESVIFIPVLFSDESSEKVLDFYVSNDIPKENIYFQSANTEGIDYDAINLCLMRLQSILKKRCF